MAEAETDTGTDTETERKRQTHRLRVEDKHSRQRESRTPKESSVAHREMPTLNREMRQKHTNRQTDTGRSSVGQTEGWQREHMSSVLSHSPGEVHRVCNSSNTCPNSTHLVMSLGSVTAHTPVPTCTHLVMSLGSVTAHTPVPTVHTW